MKKDSALVSSDTSRESAAKQLEALRKMDISDRAEMTFQLSDNLRSIIESGIRDRHPEYSPKEIIQAVLKLTLDKDLFEKAFPGSEVAP